MKQTNFTRPPWKWHRIGAGWVLCGEHGDLPYVLDVGRSATGRVTGLRLRDEALGLMVAFDPEHPDAKTIAAAADLRTTLVGVLKHTERLIAICREAAARHDDLSLDEQAAYAEIGIDEARELLAKLGGAS